MISNVALFLSDRSCPGFPEAISARQPGDRRPFQYGEVIAHDWQKLATLVEHPLEPPASRRAGAEAAEAPPPLMREHSQPQTKLDVEYRTVTRTHR
jgi:hypothetical protein